MTTGCGTPGMEIGVGKDGRCLSSQAALPSFGSSPSGSRAEPAAANAALLALADRCEAATGEDRSLDREIALATRPEILSLEVLTLAIDECGYGVLPYTSSIDAAMLLVPDGWAVERSGWQSLNPQEPYADFELWQYRKGKDGDWWHGGDDGRTKAGAKHPALALCAAALRARAASADTRPKDEDPLGASLASGAVPATPGDAQTSEANND